MRDFWWSRAAGKVRCEGRSLTEVFREGRLRYDLGLFLPLPQKAFNGRAKAYFKIKVKEKKKWKVVDN